MYETKRVNRRNRLEVVMKSIDDKGSSITLMQFTDEKSRNITNNPGKLVFYAKDVNQFAANIFLAGGQIILPPTPQPNFGNALVGFARDTENNLIEMVQHASASVSYFSAYGLGVSDLDAAHDFYVNVVGFEEEAYLEIPGQYNEYILQSPVPGDSALVLMHWTNGSDRIYHNNPTKLEIETGLPTALAIAIKKSNNTVTRFPRRPRMSDLAGITVGYAKDADGNTLELHRSNKSYLDAAGLGVENLNSAVSFYKTGLAMTEVERRVRYNRVEVVMESADARGSNITLMQFSDGLERNFNQNPGKLVFYVNDPSSFAYSISAADGTILLPPVAQPEFGGLVIGFARDNSGNLLEIVGVASAAHSYLAAFGIGVSDLEEAKDFYTQALGFKVEQFLRTPSYDEYILQADGGSALVLMHWTNGSERNYQDNPVKLELRTLSPIGAVANLIQEKAEITQLPRHSTDEGLKGEIVGYAKDADGTLLELLKAPWGKAL